jgi:DNA polymerase-4
VTETRTQTLSNPTDDAQVLADTALLLLRRIKTKERKVRLVGLSAGKLVGVGDEPHQLGLFESEDKKRRLNRTVDEVTKRFGKGSIRRASLLEETSRGKGSD